MTETPQEMRQRLLDSTLNRPIEPDNLGVFGYIGMNHYGLIICLDHNLAMSGKTIWRENTQMVGYKCANPHCNNKIVLDSSKYF